MTNKPGVAHLEIRLPPEALRANLGRLCREARWPPRSAGIHDGSAAVCRVRGSAERFRLWTEGVGSRTVPVLDCRATGTGTGATLRVHARRSRATQARGPALASFLAGVPAVLGWASPLTVAMALVAGGAVLLYDLFEPFSGGTEKRVQELRQVLARAAHPDSELVDQ